MKGDTGGQTHVSWRRRGRWLRVFLIVVVAVLALQPCLPPVTGAEAPPTSFSTARALQHLGHIAQEPRPIGSPAHERVRRYLLDELGRLGLELLPQDAATALTTEGGRPLRVRNVVARLRGRAPGAAILVDAHYDSVAEGPGAGDNGAAVAVLLETLRALCAGPRLRQDVIALFTDGEESGLLGAEAFASAHPWRDDVGLVLNFDARGSRGPSLMFETGPGAADLVAAYAACAPCPQASSLMAAVYERMPNGTDFTVFRGAGRMGLNFAFVGGYETYHTQLDTIDHLDPRSLAHHGETMLALLRRLGNEPLPRPAAVGAIWFNPVGAVLVRYPATLVWPQCALSLLLLCACVALGVRAGCLRAAGLARGIVWCLATMAAATALAMGCAHLVLWGTDAARRHPIAHTGQDPAWLLAIACATVVLATLFLSWSRRRVHALELTVATMVLWAAGQLFTCVWLPGASFLFLWPPLLPLLVLLANFAPRWRGHATARVGLYMAAAVPALTIVGPLVVLFLQALALPLGFLVTPLLVLVLGLLWPVLAADGDPARDGCRTRAAAD